MFIQPSSAALSNLVLMRNSSKLSDVYSTFFYSTVTSGAYGKFQQIIRCLFNLLLQHCRIWCLWEIPANYPMFIQPSSTALSNLVLMGNSSKLSNVYSTFFCSTVKSGAYAKFQQIIRCLFNLLLQHCHIWCLWEIPANYQMFIQPSSAALSNLVLMGNSSKLSDVYSTFFYSTVKSGANGKFQQIIQCLFNLLLQHCQIWCLCEIPANYPMFIQPSSTALSNLVLMGNSSKLSDVYSTFFCSTVKSGAYGKFQQIIRCLFNLLLQHCQIWC